MIFPMAWLIPLHEDVSVIYTSWTISSQTRGTDMEEAKHKLDVVHGQWCNGTCMHLSSTLHCTLEQSLAIAQNLASAMHSTSPSHVWQPHMWASSSFLGCLLLWPVQARRQTFKHAIKRLYSLLYSLTLQMSLVGPSHCGTPHKVMLQ